MLLSDLLFVLSVQIAARSALLSGVSGRGAATGPGQAQLQPSVHEPGDTNCSGRERGTGENPASVAAMGRLSGFCSNSSSVLSFREHLMAAQTGYFSCPHIAIDLEKVN